jgi:hypothetical protein
VEILTFKDPIAVSKSLLHHAYYCSLYPVLASLSQMHVNFCTVNENRLLLFQALLRFLFGGRIPFIPVNPHATVPKRAWNFSSPVRKNALDTPLKKEASLRIFHN